MASETLSMEFDPKDKAKLQKLINNVVSGVSTMEPFFDAVEMHMIGSLTDNFEKGGRPKRWSPLAPITIEMKGSSSVLQNKGNLKNSLNAQNTKRGKLSLEMWAGEQHGLFHQFADVEPSKQFGMTNKRGMPMRPFILFQKQDIKEIEKQLGKFIDDVMGGS
jgi:phage gpG-like protein